MIYFIDEDTSQTSHLRLELELSGNAVKHYKDADTAYEAICELFPNDFLIVDVMLAANPDETKSIYGRAESDDYKTTGLLLLEKLFMKFPNFPKSRVLLISQASILRIIERIQSFCKVYGVVFKGKDEFESNADFGSTVQRMLDNDKEGK